MAINETETTDSSENIELESVELSHVIDAVRKASDQELSILTDISNKLDPAIGSGPIKNGNAVADLKGIEKAVKKGVESANTPSQAQKSESHRANNRNRVKPSVGARKNETILTNTRTEGVEPALINEAEQVDTLRPAPSVSQTLEQMPGEDQSSAIGPSNSEVKVVTNHDLDIVPDTIEKAIKNGLAGFDGYWKDTAGRLRRKDGKYASKDESTAYSAAEIAKQRETGKDNEAQKKGLFAQFTGTLKSFAKEQISPSNSNATEAAGAAAGGTLFYSAKEIHKLSQETKEAFSHAKDGFGKTKVKLDDAKERLASTKIGRALGVNPAESVVDASDSKSLSTVNEQAKSKGERSSKDQSRTNKSSDLAEQVSRATSTSSSEMIAERSLNETSSSSKSERSETDSTQNKAVETSRIKSVTSAKNESYKSEHLETLREGTEADVQHAKDITDRLDDVVDAIKTTSGEGGGLMDLAGNMFDGKGRKNKKGKRGRAGKGGRAGKVRSVLSGGQANVKGIANKGVSMASGAFKGLSKLGGLAGKAIPLLAPIMATYDAVSGYNDKAKQKEIFNLKEGEEASVGQKSATALGSVLDVGGLVSGGAGLIGSFLGSMGFDGAQEAMTFDSGDIAKRVYTLFGGNDEQVANEIATSDSANPNMSSIERRKHDQLRQKEVESLAQNGDFKNARFISPELKVSMDKSNESIETQKEEDVYKQVLLDAQKGSVGSAVEMSASLASAESLVRANERVSEIKAAKADQEFRRGQAPSTVKIDDESIKQLQLTTKKDIQPVVPIKHAEVAATPVKPVGSAIPNNFSDRSLQRQSADLE